MHSQSENLLDTTDVPPGRRNGIVIQFNGQPREVPRGATVAALLEQLGLRPAYVGVEINQELAPRSQHAQRVLEQGDRVEVVSLVGGG
jgi:sulfur carrier protein